MSDKCKHEWEYYDLLCFPPIKKKRCKLCGYEHEWDLPQAEKVEDSGSEADFGTKDKEESWEEHWKSKIRSILLDEELSLNGRHNRIMEVVEAEKKKAEARGFNTLLATSGCYSFEQTKQLIETEKKKLAMDISKDIEIRLNIKHKTYDEIKRCVLEGWQRT